MGVLPGTRRSFGEIRLIGLQPDLDFGCVVIKNGAMRAEFADDETNHRGGADASTQ